MISKNSTLHIGLQKGASVCGYAIDASSLLVTEVDPFEKTLKVISKSTELFCLIAKETSESAQLILTQLKGAIVLTETFSFFRSLQLAVIPNKKNGKLFFFDSANSWQIRASRLNMLIHSSLKLFVLAKSWKFIELAIASRYLIGQLPTFRLITDGTYGLYNAFGFMDSTRLVINCIKASSLVNKKIAKWESRQSNVNKIAMGDVTAIQELDVGYIAKLSKLQQLPSTDKTNAKISTLQQRLQRIVNNEYEILAKELSDQVITPKLKKWKFDKFTVEQNRHKAMCGMVSTAAKGTAVAVSLLCVAISFMVPAVSIYVIASSLLGDVFGISKILLDKLPPTYKYK